MLSSALPLGRSEAEGGMVDLMKGNGMVHHLSERQGRAERP